MNTRNHLATSLAIAAEHCEATGLPNGAHVIREAVALLEEIRGALEDCINQACSVDGYLDSMAISAYADGMRLLARVGSLQISHDVGRRVMGDWVKGLP